MYEQIAFKTGVGIIQHSHATYLAEITFQSID